MQIYLFLTDLLHNTHIENSKYRGLLKHMFRVFLDYQNNLQLENILKIKVVETRISQVWKQSPRDVIHRNYWLRTNLELQHNVHIPNPVFYLPQHVFSRVVQW